MPNSCSMKCLQGKLAGPQTSRGHVLLAFDEACCCCKTYKLQELMNNELCYSSMHGVTDSRSQNTDGKDRTS
ncbi:hypothetical protein PVAP13_8NG169800 [Panicum virgatum]|uniref:Uncharacterized protein n=1 Tax=Panicum virgatum TaxID=38727 RepID=A0A8T0P964_PANVG|nr:hypothetical protein PVAP13_8NG169800 [Panicum virgatum]